jgi:hypothetical protein
VVTVASAPAQTQAKLAARSDGRRMAPWLVLAALYVGAVGLLFASRVREFADESDNLLGGLLITRGERLYVDYFSSHMPFAYYLAAIPAALGAQRLEEFRPFTNALLVAATLLVVLGFRHRLSLELLGTWAVLTVFAHRLQFGEMLTAGTTAGFGCLVAGLLFFTRPGLKFDRRGEVALSAAVFVAIQSALLSVYPLAVLAAAYLLMRVRDRHWRSMLRLGLIVAVPNLLVLLGLWLSGAFPAFVYDAIQFNQAYYAQYLMNASPIGMLHDWEAQYRTYLLQSLADPLGVQAYLVTGNIVAAVLIGRRRGWLVGAAVYLFIALSHIRTEDGYYLVSYASLALDIVWAITALGRSPARLIAVPVLLLAGAFVVRVAMLYDLGPAPARNAPEVAVIQALSEPGERIFAAPYDPYLYLATQRMPATTLPFFFPWQAADPRSESQLIAEIRNRRPALIVFRKWEAVNDRWPLGESAQRVERVIRERYTPLDESAPVLQDLYVPTERLDDARARAAGLIAQPATGP